jgi:hypothetical protein
MILVEIALQNARTFPPKLRLGLHPGLNVVRVDTAEQRAMLLDCVYFPLFPDPSRAGATEHLVGDEGAARAALSIFGRDEQAYRLLRDLASGATRLYRFETEAKKYRLLTEVTTEAAQYVRVQQQLPDEVSFERLFLVGADNRPSLGARARSRSGTPVVAEGMASGSYPSLGGVTGSFTGDAFSSPPRASSGGGWGPGAGTPPFGAASPFGAGAGAGGTFGSSLNLTNALVQSELEGGAAEPEAARKEDLMRELTNLVRHLEVARRAEGAQTELDQLQRRRADLTQRAEVLVRARAQADELAQALAEQSPAMSEVSPNLRQRLEGFEEAEARYRNELKRLDAEMEALGVQSQTLDLVTLEKDPYFLGGVGVALLSLALAFGLDLGWIALFNLVGAAVAAGAAFRYVNDLEGRERLEGRLRFSDERRARIEKQYELETAMIRRAMQKLEIEDHRELARRIDIHQDLKTRADDAREAVQRAESDPSITGAARDLETVNARIRELEPLVMGSGGSLQSPEQMERRIRTLRRELVAMGVEPGSVDTGNIPVVEGTADVAGPRRLSDDDDDDGDDGYEAGYGGGGRYSGSGSSGGADASAAGLWAMSSGGSGAGGFGGVSNYGFGGYDGGGGLSPDRSRDLMQAGADLVQMDVEGLVGRFQPRLVQYLSALSDGRLTGCSFGPRGELTVRTRDGEERPYVHLGGEGLDLVDLALRLALVESIASRSKIPLVVDDHATDYPERRRKLFVQMLGHISKLTQVVVFSGAEDIPGRVVDLESK